MAYPVQADPTAVFGRRVLAALLDAALILVPVIMLITSEFEYLSEDRLDVSGEDFCDAFLDQEGGFCISGINDRVYFNDGSTGAGTAVYWGGTFALLVLLQGFTGWTFGKLITGIRVVREDGRPPGFVKALVRWLLWIVDGFPYVIPLVGFIVGLTTTGHRRVGDMAAKTFVVRSSAAGSPVVVPGLTAAPAAAAAPWGAPAPPTDPSAAGWGAPAAPPTAPPAPAAPAVPAPQWDEARRTYIQWDPTQSTWMQWDEATKTWSRIPGQ